MRPRGGQSSTATRSLAAHTNAVLRDSGMRASSGRAAVTEVLATGDCLMSAHDITDRLRDDALRSASISTVYRTLEILHDRGLVRRFDSGEGVARYEPIDPSGSDEHHHVLYDDGTVTPFTDTPLAHPMAGLGTRLGVEIEACEVIVRARRRRCDADRRVEAPARHR